MDKSMEIRRLRYRIKRQGMLELDTWLAKLEAAISSGDKDVIEAISVLLAYEPPELQAMMHGGIALPKVLRKWLEIRS